MPLSQVFDDKGPCALCGMAELCALVRPGRSPQRSKAMILGRHADDSESLATTGHAASKLQQWVRVVYGVVEMINQVRSFFERERNPRG